tara:strand:- start:1487 stop:1933 length:447 start_codon:yes stop_codon:yes gene_type:complete
MSNFEIIDLEKHETKDVKDSHVNGELTIIWRDWDNIIKNPKMIYVNSVDPGEIKGPHLHKNRTSYFHCIEGEIVIVIQDNDSNYHEIETNSKESKLISISNGVPAAIVNPSNSISKILVLADISWKPNDNEMENVSFLNYDWQKWKKN